MATLRTIVDTVEFQWLREALRAQGLDLDRGGWADFLGSPELADMEETTDCLECDDAIVELAVRDGRVYLVRIYAL